MLRGVDLSESVAALPPTTAGSRYHCTLEARDSFNNARSRGGDTVVVTCTGAETCEGSAVDNGDGTYEVCHSGHSGHSGHSEHGLWQA